MNFWSVKNVQKYHNCINPSLSTVKNFFCHAEQEVLWVHYLNAIKQARHLTSMDP